MRPEHRFLLACMALTGATLVAVWLPADPIVRTLFALPLVFVLPGAALLRAADLRFAPHAHASLVIAVSMAMTVVSGLALHWLGGLTPLGWAAWLGGVTVLAAALAARRGVSGPHSALPSVALRHVVMLAATCGVLVLTFIGAVHRVQAYRPFAYTNFWMLAQAAVSGVYRIGITNGEERPETYAVRLMVDRRLAGEWQDLTLAPAQTLTYPVVLLPGASAEAWLFRADRPGMIYRKVTVAGETEPETPTGSPGEEH